MSPPRRMGRALSWLCVALCLWLAACAEERPSQLIIVVGTDFPEGMAPDTVRVAVQADGLEGELLYDRAVTLRTDRPTTFALSDESGSARKLYVSVEGKVSGELVVRRRARVTLVPRKALRLDMYLHASCARVSDDGQARYEACEQQGQTCGASASCEPVERESLPTWRGETPRSSDVPAGDLPIDETLPSGEGGTPSGDGDTEPGDGDAPVGDGDGPPADHDDGGVPPDAQVDGGAMYADDEVMDLALGKTHSCALFGSGRMLCWGSNEYGELGREDKDSCRIEADSQCLPGEPQEVADAIDVTAGDHFTCAVLRDRTVRCWGLNTVQQSGGSGEDTWVPPTVITKLDGLPLSSVDQVVAGALHACARDDDDVYCWGDNTMLQLSEVGFPVNGQADNIEGVQTRFITAGGLFSCATGKLGPWCWGENLMRQLAQADTSPHQVTRVSELVAQQISAGAEHLCMLVQGEVWCVGSADNGRLGVGDISALMLPTCKSKSGIEQACTEVFRKAKFDAPVLSIAVGGAHACAIVDDADRGVACWGALAAAGNPWGYRYEPTKMDDLRNTRIVAAGGDHSCAVDEKGVWCWGRNDSGQLGTVQGGGTPSPRFLPLVAP